MVMNGAEESNPNQQGPEGGFERQEPPSHTQAAPASACAAGPLSHWQQCWGKERAEMVPLLLGQSPLNSPLTARHSGLQWKPT